MYPIDPASLNGLRQGRWSGVGRNVLCLGLTSMFTDISAEMVASILPVYMAFALRLTPLQFGFIDGLYHGAASVAGLASGLLADRFRRNREVATVGYALSAICKLGLLAAGNAWLAISSVIALDRIGKGIRTAPRDALISLSSAPQRLGLAFGLHRAFDTAGALLGPLLAFAILAMLPGAYDVIFVTSFFIAVVGVAALVLLVSNVRPAASEGVRDRSSLASALGLLRGRSFRSLLICGSALALLTMADSFFFLVLQRSTSMDVSSFPLLYVGTALTYLLLAIPAGRLADRIGRGRVFMLGHASLLCACVSLLASGRSLVSGLLSLTLLGAYYACTDGVLAAATSALLPTNLRSTGLAVLTTATGTARLLASVLFGAAWHVWGIEFAVGLFVAGLATAMLLTWRTLVRLDEVE